MNTNPVVTAPSDVLRTDLHYRRLIESIPPWLRQASPDRRAALRPIKPGMPAPLKSAPARQRTELSELLTRHLEAQNRVDQTLTRLANPDSFAEPLLRDELKTRFGLDLDVRNTWLHLYLPTHLPWLPIKARGARTWTVSLLDAALHNFENDETRPDAFEAESTYITPPTANGQFQTLPNILKKMPIAAFTKLCRTLDIGERYRNYLEDNLGISNPVTAALLKSSVRESQNAALAAALHMARMQALLNGETHRTLLDLLEDRQAAPSGSLPWIGHALTILDSRLTGIVLFAPDLERSPGTVSVVAYIPDDPLHPIKQYPSSAAFAEELTRRLREPDYQRFFSRFIGHEDRGRFFATLNNRLTVIAHQPAQPPDPRPTWREKPVAHPNLQLLTTPIRTGLLTHLHQSKLDKILNDARTIAISTASADRKKRWALWDSLMSVASTLLNVAAFIAAPFVPLLGEAVLAYMTYQMLDQTFESLVEWSEGQTSEAFGHFMGVVESAVQLGAFAAGGMVAANEWRTLLPRDIVGFIDRFNVVRRPDGQTRYWQPDLTTYEHPATLPKGSTPDALGLHRHQGKCLLPLENNLYAVSEDPVTGLHRIDHPTRTHAYKPALRHNHAGAWQTELDQPLDWDRDTLLRRFGPDMQRFSAGERESMLRISGCDENALRRLHANNEPMPALLQDTLMRLRIDRDIQAFIDAIGSERPEVFLRADPVMQLKLLDDYGPRPANVRFRLIDGASRILWQSPATDVSFIALDIAKLHDGDLLKTLLLSLPDSEAKVLLNEERPTAPGALEARARTLRQALRQLAIDHRPALFDQRYSLMERGASGSVQALMDSGPGLPKGLAQAIEHLADEQERQQLKTGRVSSRLADICREAGLQVRIARAYEGLELPSTADNPDTGRLVLLALENLPEPERLALGTDIVRDETLRRQVRQHAPDRETLRTLLAQQPILKQTYDPKVMRLLGGGDGYRLKPSGAPTLHNHAQALFPHLSPAELDAFVERIQRHPAGPREVLHQLITQHDELRRTLSTWINAIAPHLPDTRISLTQDQRALQQRIRQQFTVDLTDCWRRQWTLAETGNGSIEFRFLQPIIGDLPRLNADFNAINGLTLISNGTTRGAHEFLRSFSGLSHLTLHNIPLGHLPVAVSRSPDLVELILSDCAVTLNARTQTTLSEMRRLTTLDLYSNPLGMTPDVSKMPDLSHLNLSWTGISQLPNGLLTRPHLSAALLNGNRIPELPEALFNLPRDLQNAFDLNGNPFTAAAREHLRQYVQRTGQNFRILAEESDIHRVRTLYPAIDRDQASYFLYLLPGTTGDARARLGQLELELTTLEFDLAAWTADVPALHPLSNQPFSPRQLMLEHLARDEFKQNVLRCWRRETELNDIDEPEQPGHILRLETRITGELPALRADFRHVSMIHLTSQTGLATDISRFLESFPNLSILSLRGFRLENIPEPVFRMSKLISLNLPDCLITLSPQSALALAQMDRMKYLELSDNPLSLTPDIRQMTNLISVQLDNCGLTELPEGLFQLKDLETVGLTDNAITEIPPDILELPMEIAEIVELRGNPLSQESMRLLSAYFRTTAVDFGVEAIIEQTEMEITDSEDSETEE
ncbi:dermonecrotic toxin domain-containing protein [Pseudomonas sp. NPDC089534]|uniref:dermonecrotic toxin domain-containing protein n=1 Tax=Pseudomonas sp. NPDC089534 TaxID=3364468 RepID=UPI003807AC19